MQEKPRYIHIIHEDEKKFGGSGRLVVKEICRGNLITINLVNSIFRIFSGSKRGDKLIFHSRISYLTALPFLFLNKINGRNKIAYNPHTQMNPTLLNKIFLSFADKIICFTKYDAKRLSKSGVYNTIVIPNPIPINKLEKYKNMQQKKKYDVVWAGRDVPFKRMEIFIEAVKRDGGLKSLILSPKISDEHKNQLRGVDNIETCEGLIDDDFFSRIIRSEWYIFTSDDREGLPVLVLEVMYLGIPIISTDTEKYREILGDSAIFWKERENLISIFIKIKNGELKPKINKTILEKYMPDAVFEKYNSW